MANTVRRHLLALLSLAILTWSVVHAKALEENEDEVLNFEKRDGEEAKEIVLAERDSDNEQVEEAEKRDAENQETEAEDEEVQKRDSENEEDKEKVEKREPEIQEDEEAVEERAPENREDEQETENKEEEAEQEKEVVEKREPEEEAQKETAVEVKREEVVESEDTEVEDLETRGIHAPFTLVDWRGRRINGQREGLLLFSGGTVCRDQFSMNSAHAICRTMGYMQATRYRYGYRYGSFQNRKRIRLTNVRCTSTNWASCRSSTNVNRCNHRKDILLTCQGTGFKLLNRAGNLVTGRREGLLTYQHGTVCDDYFNSNAAHAICRVMGYAYAVRWRHGYYYGMEQGHRPIVMDDVRCRATYWNYCSYRVGTHNCGHGEDVFLTCQPGTPHPPGFRLVDWRGGNAQRGCEGLLLYNGGTVCDDYFNMNAAHAICRVLRFRSAVSYRSGLAYGTMQTRKRITMDNVRCRSTTWSSCRFNTRHNCGHSEDILLKCRP